jgi:hypothetical protein
VVCDGDQFGDWRSELVGEIGGKHMRALEAEAVESKARAEKKLGEFSEAVRTVDAVDLREQRRREGFKGLVEGAERIARGNLAYLADA